MNIEQVLEYIRAVLYLFSIYNIVSMSIVHWRERKLLSIIHILASFVLSLNFISLFFAKILGFNMSEIIIFDYLMTFFLLILNIIVMVVFYSKKIKTYNDFDKLSNLASGEKSNLSKLMKLANSQ